METKIFKLTKLHYYLIQRFKPTQKDISDAIKASETYSTSSSKSSKRTKTLLKKTKTKIKT